MWHEHGGASMHFREYYQHIYYSSFTRFDELLPGVAIALIKNFHSSLFARMMNRSNLILFFGVFVIGIMFYLFPHYHASKVNGYHFFLSTMGYSLVAIGFAFLTVSALSHTSLLGKVRVPGAAHIALWSYAIYLIHKPLFQLLMAPLTEMNIDVKAPIGVTIIMLLSILAGWLLFKFVETPFMNIRAKLYPTNLADDSAQKMRVAVQ